MRGVTPILTSIVACWPMKIDMRRAHKGKGEGLDSQLGPVDIDKQQKSTKRIEGLIKDISCWASENKEKERVLNICRPGK